jgi:hypothetical protein
MAPGVIVASIITDRGTVRHRLETELDPEELGRHLRAGGRRTRQEATDIGRTALVDHLDELGSTA